MNNLNPNRYVAVFIGKRIKYAVYAFALFVGLTLSPYAFRGSHFNGNTNYCQQATNHKDYDNYDEEVSYNGHQYLGYG